MAGYDWSTPRAAIAAAVTSATGIDKTIGSKILTEVDAFGPGYDHTLTSAIETQRTAALAKYSTDLATWTSARLAAFNAADRAARHAEAAYVALYGATFGKDTLAPTTALVLDVTKPRESLAAVDARIVRARTLPTSSAAVRAVLVLFSAEAAKSFSTMPVRPSFGVQTGPSGKVLSDFSATEYRLRDACERGMAWVDTLS